MTYGHPGRGPLDYVPVRYAGARLDFRGPEPDLDEPYVAFLGGTETYGKFIPRPFPELVEDETGLTALNLGCVNAGVDSYLSEPALMDLISGAETAVIQIMGAHHLSNRFYSVHPRRNDRFVRASTLLRTVYRDVDFTEFAFVRHLLGALRDRSEERFALVVEELHQVWVQRMVQLIERIETRVVLLWMARRAPPLVADGDPRRPDADPPFVDAGMLARVARAADACVEVVASGEARAAGTRGMAYSEMEAPAAAALLGPKVHEEAAEALAPVLAGLRQRSVALP